MVKYAPKRQKHLSKTRDSKKFILCETSKALFSTISSIDFEKESKVFEPHNFISS